MTTSEITAFAWKWSDGDHVYTMLLRADGQFSYEGHHGWSTTYPAKDAYVLFVSEIAEADMVYGHNIRRHDLPMLNAGLIRRQLDPLPTLLTSDTCRDLPKMGGMSKSLENLVGYYGIEGEKCTMSQPMWEDANRLTPEGIELARKRVESDVLLQERLRNKLLEVGILRQPREWRP